MRDVVAYQRKQGGCRNLSHAAQRLMNGCQWRMVCGCRKNIVEAEYGNILGDAQSCFANCGDSADGSDVVEGKDRGERALCLQEQPSDLLSGSRSGLRALQLYDEMIIDLKVQIAGGLNDRLPTELCI